MKIIPKVLLTLMLGGFPVAGLFAQQEILAASCDAAGSGGTVSWSVGQVAYSAWSDAAGFLTEGVQQPYEIFNITGIDEQASGLQLIVYPNPTSGKITVKKVGSNLKILNIKIYDIEGSLLRTLEVYTEEATIPMDDLPSATYILNILEKNQLVKTCKIIKK